MRYIKRKLSLVIVLAITVLTLSACIPKFYTEELLETTSKEYVPKATQWFETNMPEAKEVTYELFHTNMNLTNLVEGTFIYDGISYDYLLNVDNNCLYSNKGYDLMKKTTHTIVKDYLDIPFKNIEISGSFLYNISCTEIINRRTLPTEKEIDVKYEEYDFYKPYLPWDYTEDDIKKWVTDELTTLNTDDAERIQFTIFLKDYQILFERDDLFDILDHYPGISRIDFAIKDQETLDSYYIESGKNGLLIHSYFDENDELQYENIKLK